MDLAVVNWANITLATDTPKQLQKHCQYLLPQQLPQALTPRLRGVFQRDVD